MVAVLITDYERALLDTIREDVWFQNMINLYSKLPATEADEESFKRQHSNEWRGSVGLSWVSKAKDAEAMAKYKAEQEEYRLLYNARGYREPYEYGKGRVKVLMESMERGTQAETR